jgi:hypothetical protein
VSPVVGVLVEAAEGDPGGLLAYGACGATPPVCSRRWREERWIPYWVEQECEEALPLWWGGALVPGGWSRAREVAMTRPMATGLWLALGAWGPGRVPDEAAARLLARELVANGLGSRVVLVDADGRDVAP